MCYNPSCHTVRYGALFISSADVSIAYRYWVKHPVLLDYRPADCVTTSASNTGCFVMTVKHGKPCVKCGSTERYSRGQCAQCARENTRRWQRENPEKKLEYSRQWSIDNAEKKAERLRQWRKNNPVKVAEHKKRWQKNNPERHNEKSRQWSKANPEKRRSMANHRRTLKTAAGGSYTAAEWKSLVEHYGHKCLCCGRTDVKLTADHVVPVSMGGTSNIDNLQPLCGRCNSSKCNKVIDYRPDKGLGRWIQKKLFG